MSLTTGRSVPMTSDASSIVSTIAAGVDVGEADVVIGRRGRGGLELGVRRERLRAVGVDGGLHRGEVADDGDVAAEDREGGAHRALAGGGHDGDLDALVGLGGRGGLAVGEEFVEPRGCGGLVLDGHEQHRARVGEVLRIGPRGHPPGPGRR